MTEEISSTLGIVRQFAESMAMPVFIIDPDGNVRFYNEPAGAVLGRKFEDTGPVAASTWTRIFMPTDESGSPLLPEFLPLMIALREFRPNYGTMWIEGIDNVRRHIGVAAFPITEHSGEHIGAVAIFWDLAIQQDQ
jgi:PAS domain-containing protein